jgi:putative membrane-bound dehydrogenase-like protein
MDRRSIRIRKVFISVSIAVFAARLAGAAFGEEVVPHRQDRPPNRPYTPAEAMARMAVPEGFAVELVASEPEIVNPLALAFDDRGRIWVTESIEYPRQDGGAGRDRIQVLEDEDGDGRAESVRVVIDGLNIPSGIALGHGGVWVANAPDLLFFRLDGDAPASRETVVTGFGRTDRHELPNSLTWGPDGWLYGLNGVFNRSRIVSGGREHRFTCALFRVHPRTRAFEVVCEGTSNPWGLIWDAEGSAIVSACHWAKDHVFHFVESAIYQRQAGPYPDHAWPLGSASDHGHQKTAYCGLAWLDSDAYPEPYRRRLYIGNVHGNCINADVLERDGATYRSRAAPDFLSANDAWFMPVAQKVGPDGCLYIADWYDRYHCYQDAGRDPGGIDRERGRIYRVRHRGSPRAPRFDLAAESDAALAARLSSPNVFFRESAQRILAERGTGGAALQGLLDDPSASRTARLHALWALLGQGALDRDRIGRLLAHPDAAFRAWGVRAAAAQWSGDGGEGALGARLEGCSFDAAPEVLLQAAIAAPKLKGLDALPMLVNALSACGEDRMVPPIAWQNLHPLLETRAADFVRLAAAADLRRAPALARILPRAAARMLDARPPDLASAAAVLDRLLAVDQGLAAECVAVFAQRIPAMSKASIEDLAARLRPSLAPAAAAAPAGALALLAARLGIVAVDAAAARGVFLSKDAPSVERLQALDALIAAADDGLFDALGEVLAAAPPPLAAGVIAALSRVDSPRVAGIVLERFAKLDAETQPLAVDLLLERRPWARALLDAVLAGALPRQTLDAGQIRRILAGNDREAIWAIERAWGAVRAERDPERERVLAEVLDRVRERPGEPRAGRAVFKEHCSRCHAIYGEGADVGPDLTANGRASFEQLAANVLDPSLIVGPGYESTTVVSTGGRVLTGILVESGDRVALKLAGARRESLPRAQVKYIHTEKLSLMPEGLETTLSPQQLSDLFAFLALDGPPEESPRPIPGAPEWLKD